jgi:uracil-DNA glycosylase
MITSFFAPKKKKVDSAASSKKRPREDAAVVSSSASNGKKKSSAIITPSNSSVSSKTTASDTTVDTAAELISYLSPQIDWSTNPQLTKQFTTSKFKSLSKFISNERLKKPNAIYPPSSQIFSALNLTPLHTVKVVIVGQDPYHQPNQGHGLAFSVPPGIKIPPSLRNIYKELYNDTNIPEFNSIPTHGNLTRWAKQGVLLLNNVLTVRRGEAASHSKRGWEEFTDAVIEAVLKRDDDVSVDDSVDEEEEDKDATKKKKKKKKGNGVVFLLWGKPASLKAQTVLSKQRGQSKQKHAVIMCSHPSPLGATKTSSPFMGSRCFSRANDELRKRGYDDGIDWRVDGPLKEGGEEDEDEEEEGRGLKTEEEDGDNDDDEEDLEC